MPVKIKPAYFTNEPREVEDKPLSDDDIDKILKSCTVVADEQCLARARKDLNTIAKNYRLRSAESKARPSSAQQRAALQEVSECAKKLHRAMEGMDTGSLSALMLRTSLGFDDLTNLKEHLEYLSFANEGASTKSTTGGRPVEETSASTVRELSRVYEKITSLRFTHNPNRKTEYSGCPQSKAGRFVIAFFELVDPAVTPQQISTAMRFVTSSRRKASKNGANPSPEKK